MQGLLSEAPTSPQALYHFQDGKPSISHHPSKLQASLTSLEPSPLPASSFLLTQPALQDSGSSQCGAIVPAMGASPDNSCAACQPLHDAPTAKKARLLWRREVWGSACTSDPHRHIKATLGPGREGDCPQGHV